MLLFQRDIKIFSNVLDSDEHGSFDVIDNFTATVRLDVGKDYMSARQTIVSLLNFVR